MDRRSRFFWGELPAMLVVGALSASGLWAQEVSPYGINVHAPAGQRLRVVFNKVDAGGIGWVRIDFIWAVVQPAPGVYDWSLYDGIVAAAQARGLNVLALIAYTPAWATEGPEISGVPRNISDWSDFCFRAARRYRNTIRHWEIWNEPNLDHFWAGSRREYIDRILQPAADAIRAANPDAQVGGPALAHLVSGDRDWYRWLLEVLEETGERLDFVTHHAYDSDGHQDVTRKLEAETPFGKEPPLWDLLAPSLREVLEEAGWVDRAVWLTETGWATDQVGEAAQATYYEGFLTQWFTGDPARNWIDKVFFYEIQDDPAPGIPKLGILRADASEKPAYGAYRDFVASHPPPVPEPTELELAGARFVVTVSWRDQHNGTSGEGRAVAYSDEAGFFWFFDPENIELIVKVLDGRPINGNFWFFYGALSDVEYWITVTDRQSGRVRQYFNPPGNLCGRGDTTAFPQPLSAAAFSENGFPGAILPPLAALGSVPASAASAGATCTADARSLCLLGSRFRVEVDWHDQHNNRTGVGQAVPFTDESGFFWFFGSENLELAVKVLDGRPVNGRFWVFYGALSDVEYWVTVTDTATGAQSRYHNPPGNICGRGDTGAF